MRRRKSFEIAETTLTIDTQGLMELVQSGRATAVSIGQAAGAQIRVGRRVLWSVPKVRKYLESIAE